MKRSILTACYCCLSAQMNTSADWLISHTGYTTTVNENNKGITISNGLISRRFRTTHNVICIDYRNLTNRDQLLRAVKPEARLVIDGVTYQVGGACGQKQQAYLLPGWLDSLVTGSTDFVFVKYEVQPLMPLLQWKSRSWTPPVPNRSGNDLIFHYQSPLPELKDISVKVHYEMMDGIPLLCK